MTSKHAGRCPGRWPAGNGPPRISTTRSNWCPKKSSRWESPLYGYHWYTGAPTVDKATGDEKPNLSADYIGTPADALQLAAAYNGKIEWDAADHNAFFYFYRDQCGSGSSIPTCIPSAIAINL